MKKVLVALDGSKRSERSLEWVRALTGAKEVTLLRVVEPVYALDVYAGTLLQTLDKDARQYLEKLADDFSPRAETLVRFGPAAPMIVDAAEEIGADLIAIATHGGSKVTRRILGGTTEQLIHGSTIPLLVVPSWTDMPQAPKIRKILVPLDGSEISEKILPLAWRIGQRQDALVILAHVVTGGSEAEKRYAELEGHFRGIIQDLDRNWATANLVIQNGEVPDALLEVAKKKGADLIVMSAHGHGAMKRMFVGSVASKLIRETPVPVLVLKHAALKKLQEPKKTASQKT